MSPQALLFLWVIPSSQAQFIQPDLLLLKLELIIVPLLLDGVQVEDLPVASFLLPVLAGFSFSLGRPPEKTHSKRLFDHIQINITLIIYDTTDTAGPPRKTWGIAC